MKAHTSALVVEDDLGLRDMLVELCGQLGLEVLAAADGVEALECLGRQAVDLVLLDLNMPRMGGLELLHKLHVEPLENPPATIVLTALTDVKSHIAAIKLGALDYIEKPVRAPELWRRIRRAMQIRSLEKRLDRAEQRLQELRTTDQAIGVEATSQLFQVLEAEYNAARVGERSMTCVVVSDETYDKTLAHEGLAAGADRLRAFAQAIEERLRGADRVFRVDAAELVILLPGCDRHGATQLMDMIAQLVATRAALETDKIAMAAATYPHAQLNQASLLYRAVNLTLAQARVTGRPAHFEGF